MKPLYYRLAYLRPLNLWLWIVLVLFVFQHKEALGASEQESGKETFDWSVVAERHPGFKVLVLVEAQSELTLNDLAVLADNGLIPADRDPGLVVGLKRAVFSTTSKKWILASLPKRLSLKVIQNFVMSGIYRVGFRVEAKDYDGPLKVEVTAPRGDVGKNLVSCNTLVRPRQPFVESSDEAGNQWVTVKYPRVKYGDEIKFHFAFKYLVDTAQVLENDLLVAPGPLAEDFGPELKTFLHKGYKIDPEMPQAVKWAGRLKGDPVDAREEYKRLTDFLKKKVTYDDAKRATYFGGRSVYTELDHMYQLPSVTLASGFGCCPDTVLLECSFMRAKGIPCRTAGRFGHFFSEVYLSGRGWKSTSSTPTGIPLILATGPDHLSYQKWEPSIAIRTTRWEARVRIEPVEEIE